MIEIFLALLVAAIIVACLYYRRHCNIPPSVDAVVAKFDKAVSELHLVAEHHDDAAEDHRMDAEDLRRAANASALAASQSVSEADRARSVASRIVALTA